MLGGIETEARASVSELERTQRQCALRFFGWTVAACVLRRALHLRAFYNDFPIRSEPAAMRWRLALCRVARANGK